MSEITIDHGCDGEISEELLEQAAARMRPMFTNPPKKYWVNMCWDGGCLLLLRNDGVIFRQVSDPVDRQYEYLGRKNHRLVRVENLACPQDPAEVLIPA